VYDNGKLGFVEIEQKAEAILDTFTRLKNANIAEVARALGLWGPNGFQDGPVEAAVARRPHLIRAFEPASALCDSIAR
jgi:pyruvate dehydrogenase (quinone)